MLKRIFISLLLLFCYFSLMLLCKNMGLDDAINMILSCILFGAAMKLLVNQLVYLCLSIGLLALLFILMKDDSSVLMMLSCVLFGHMLIHYVQIYRQANLRARRRPKDENREFLN